MAFWRKKKSENEEAVDGESTEATNYGWQSIVALIRTRMNPGEALEIMKEAGLAPELAVRYLDLAVAIAAREQIVISYGDRVELPATYIPTLEIPGLPSNFEQCQISQEILAVYREEPTAVGLIAPVAPDFVAVHGAIAQNPEARLRISSPTIGDGTQAGYGRRTFGDEAILKLAEEWPELA